MRVILRIAALVFCAGPASAWQFQGDEDPLSDTKTGIAIETAGGVGLGFKCWEGRGAQLMLMLPIPFNAAATYKPVVLAQFRTDKNPVQAVSLAPSNVGGRFTLVSGDDEMVTELVYSVRDAKSRVVISAGEMVYSFPASGSSRAMEGLITRCKIAEKKPS